MVPTAAGPQMRAVPPRIEASDLLEGGSGQHAYEADEYWPDELLGVMAGNASRRAGVAGSADAGTERE